MAEAVVDSDHHIAVTQLYRLYCIVCIVRGATSEGIPARADVFAAVYLSFLG